MHYSNRPAIFILGLGILSLALLFAFFSFDPNIVRADITTGLVGYWKFDETSGTSAADSSGSGNTGTVNGGAVWTTGKTNGALSFDGVNDLVNAGSASSLDDLTSFTYSAWVYKTAQDGAIISKRNPYSGSGKYFAVDSAGGANGIKFTVDRSSSMAFAGNANVLPSNAWYFVAATYSSIDGPRIYVNGTEISYSTRLVGSGSETSDAASSLTIGSAYNTPAYLFSGKIDEVRIYSRVLSASEVSELYTASAGPSAPICGDSICNGTETCSTCSQDCGTCPVNDTQPPTVPTNLSATAVSSSQINLSWTASSDNIGVTGYRVYRGGTQITTMGTNSYSNTGLSPNTTYTYYIVAYDAAGNNSNQSSQASATTQSAVTPPAGYVIDDFNFYPTPNTAKPAKGIPFQEPTFHTRITR